MNRKDKSSMSAVFNFQTEYGNIFPVPIDQKKNRQYSREFLMKLRTSPLSLQKPKELPDNEIVRNTISDVWPNTWNKPFNISKGYIRQGFINDSCVIGNSKHNLKNISEEDMPNDLNFEEKRQKTQPITLSDFKFQNHASMKQTDQTVNKIQVMEESHQQDSHLYCVSKCRKSSAKSHKDNDVTLAFADETIPYFLSNSLNCLLEHLNEANQDIGSRVHDLYCLHAVLCLAKNCTIAISLTWENLSEIIGPLITDGTLPLSFLQDTSDLCFKPGCINCFCSFVSFILKGISKEKGACDVNKLRQSEDLQCSTKMKVPESNFVNVNADNVITQVLHHHKNFVDWNRNYSEKGYYPKNSSQVTTNKREDEVKNSLRTLSNSAIQLQRARVKAIATAKTQFLSPNTNTEEFIEENKLEFTVKQREPCKNINLSSEQLKVELAALFTSKQTENEEIFDWIDVRSECKNERKLGSNIVICCNVYAETLKTENLYKKVRCILNKLTPQKFQTLVNQVNDLLIDTEERLKGVIDLVFEKALDEPNFSVAYANLCKCLAMKKVPIGNKDNDFVNFRKLLLNKCQKEFERDTADDIARIKRAKEQHPDDEIKKRELDEELEDLERKAKRRSLGNIRFIGELFRLHMLTASIMHHCLKKLLNQEDEDSLECLCRLLTTIGKDMDSEKGKSNNKEPEDKMNGYFRQMQEIVKKRQTSPRVRLMLQDVIDWRQNNWVPRRDENNPKTLDQIHLEAEREASEREMFLTQPQSHRRMDDKRKSTKTGRVQVDSSRESSTTREEKKDVALRGNPDLTEQEIEKRAKALLDEFLHNTDFQEAILCVSEICASTTISFFVTYAFNCVLERSAQTRQQIGQLMHDLIKAKVMTAEQYIKGLQAILSLAEDYTIDIPHIWEYLGELIAPLIKDGTLPMSFLQEAAQPCFETGCGGSFVSAVLHAVSKKLGTHEVGELWRTSNLQWSQFLSPNTNTEEFIEENKLEFTVKPREPCKNTNLSSEQLKVELAALFASKQTENEEIFDWIDAHLNKSQCKDSSFVRAIVSAVCQSVLDKSDDTTITVDESLFRNRCNILRKYLDHSEPCEMQALYALQALMHQLEQPKGILYSFFGFLYDEEIISKDAFLLWEISEDPVEQEGKGVALNSVRSFYVLLKEAESVNVHDDIQLGPGGRNVVGWSRGISGGSRTSSQEPESFVLARQSNSEGGEGGSGEQTGDGGSGDGGQPDNRGTSPNVYGTHIPTPFYSRQPPPRAQVSSVNQRQGMNMGINPADKKNKTYLNRKGDSKEGGDMDAFVDKEEITVSVGSPSAPEESSNADDISSKEEERKVAEKNEENTKVSQDFERNEVIDVIDQPVTKNQTVPKYNYKEDQWSPLNPEGKRQYDRTFLLRMQTQPMSLRKPEGLPDLEVIKDSATVYTNKAKQYERPVSVSGFQQRGHIPDFIPGYVKSSGTPRNTQVGRRPSTQGGNKTEQPYPVQSQTQAMYVSTANTPFSYHGGNPPVFYSHMMPRHQVPSMPQTQQSQLPKREKKLIRIRDPTTSRDLTEEIVGIKIENTESRTSDVAAQFATQVAGVIAHPAVKEQVPLQQPAQIQLQQHIAASSTRSAVTIEKSINSNESKTDISNPNGTNAQVKLTLQGPYLPPNAKCPQMSTRVKANFKERCS